MSVKDFVRKIYITGIPYDEANEYTSADAPILLNMLQGKNESPYWGNIVVTLSIIGDERSVDPIIRFIEQQEDGELSDADYRSKSGALMALGYLINKTGNVKAINYLVESINPKVWAQRNVDWNTRLHANAEDRNVDLSTMAILGLALSGRPEAVEALNVDPANLNFQPITIGLDHRLIEIIEPALETYEQVAKDGLSEYYRKSAVGFGR